MCSNLEQNVTEVGFKSDKFQQNFWYILYLLSESLCTRKFCLLMIVSSVSLDHQMCNLQATHSLPPLTPRGDLNFLPRCSINRRYTCSGIGSKQRVGVRLDLTEILISKTNFMVWLCLFLQNQQRVSFLWPAVPTSLHVYILVLTKGQSSVVCV